MFRERFKLALSHATYTSGLTFFSTLASQFADQILTVQEIGFSSVSCFITFGIAFFASMKIQNKSCVNSHPKDSRPTIKEKKLKNLDKKILNGTEKSTEISRDVWKRIFIVTHSP